jgi:hypothetical protein
MLSRKAKHLAVAEEKTICSMARFFASLRFAQNDKLLYSLTNKTLIITNAVVSVSLSINIRLSRQANNTTSERYPQRENTEAFAVLGILYADF